MFARLVTRCYFCRIVIQITIVCKKYVFVQEIKVKKMAKVKTLADLRKMKSELQSQIQLQGNVENPESIVQIRVGMATSGIASGAKDVFNYLKDEMAKRNINGRTISVGDMGYCYAEPTVEVLVPGKESIVFGYVDVKKADLIIEKYIKHGELLDGIIPPNYQSIL